MPAKLKVAFVVHEFPVLSETFIINQAIGLIDRGCEVDIYATQLGDTDKMHPDVERYDLLDRVRLLPQVSPSYGLRLLKGIELVAKFGYRHPEQILESLNLFKRGRRAASLWSLFTAVPALSWPSYDIIHCQFGNLGFQGLLLKDFNPSAKLIVMFRGFDISQQLKTEGDRFYKSLFCQADFFLTNCEFFRQRLLKLGCDRNKVRVHYSGLDCAKFPLTVRSFDQAAEGASNSPIRIAATGRLVEKKGFEYSIWAMAQVVRRYPHVTYDIIGDGPLRKKLAALIESLNLQENVHLLGWRDEAEIIEVLTRSHLFVAPSVTSAAGNQDAPVNVLKEAMALGLPVVSTYHGGIPELVEHDISGLLVPERDASAIAQALFTLIESPERWAAMGQAGRAYVETHYGLDTLNDRLLDLYQELLQSDVDIAPKIPMLSTAIHLP
ncbi:MAG: glycosyltransferase [Phormidesmis sp.]